MVNQSRKRSYILRILHISVLEIRQSDVVLNREMAVQSICSVGVASSLEKHCQDGCRRTVSTAPCTFVKHILDQVYLVVQQGGLGYRC